MGCAENCTGTGGAASADSVQPEKPFLAVTHCHFLEQKGPTTVAPHSLVRLYPQKNQVAIVALWWLPLTCQPAQLPQGQLVIFA